MIKDIYNKKTFSAMNKKISLLASSLIVLAVCFISCGGSSSKKEKAYSLSLEGNNLYITMPHPTLGTAQLGKANWFDINLSDVVEDIYQTILDSSISGECNLFVRFIISETDKYGNENESYDEYPLLSIPVEEARKYENSQYLDNSYGISNHISEAAFPQYDTPTDSAAYYNSQPTENKVMYHRDNIFAPKEQRRSGPDFEILE